MDHIDPHEEEMDQLRVKHGTMIIPTEEDLKKINDHDMYRASGNVVCDKCGKIYYKHPMIKGYSFLTKLCNGDHVHL